MKGHPQSNCSGGGSGGGGGWSVKRVKVKEMAMAAVVILVAVMGVTVVQKLRDRRLFNLVIKDKDRQILSLHLLLQKERQYAKETKRKNQDLNAKLYSLRTQKTELNNKILEMRSMISSMRDEQRALESTIDEKQNEIQHKESELKSLRSSLRIPPKIWSVSTDDPSNPEVNLTDNVTTIRIGASMERSLGDGQKSSYRESGEIINPNIKDGKPHEEDHMGKMEIDSGKLASSKESETRGLVVDDNDDAKIQMRNITDGLRMGGRRFFTGASESNSKRHAVGQTDESQPKANWETEVKQFKSKNYSTDDDGAADMGSGKKGVNQESKSESDRTDEDEAAAEVEADMNASTESSHGSEADQD